MYCIKHLLHIDASLDKVYGMLSTIEGLRLWWTELTTGISEEGQHIDFRFGEPHIRMQVLTLQPHTEVKWQCTLAEADWIGTTVTFLLDKNENKTRLKFFHDKWPTHADFFAHCNLSWAKYLLSLKSYLEQGTGQPFKL